MPTVRTILAAAVIAALAAPAAAQDGQSMTDLPPASGDDNFSIAPAEGRHLKIDRRTGRLSVCEDVGGRWSCRLVADDRDAYEEEVLRLQEENARLAARVEELERELAARGEEGAWIGPEDEQKLEEFLDFSDKAIRRFFDMVEDLRSDLGQPDSL